MKHPIKAFGVPNITNTDLRELKQSFSPSIQRVWTKVASPLTGDVEVLVGANYIGLHLVDNETSGNMKVKKSLFGSGFVALGCHKSVKSDAMSWDVTVSGLVWFGLQAPPRAESA